MEPERLYDDVIVRYLLNEANPEEEQFVINWMKADEQNRLYVESLRNTLQLVDLRREAENVNLDNEWDHFRQLVSGSQQATTRSFNYDTPDWDIHEDNKNSRARVYRILLTTAVAASLILLVGLGAGWFSSPVKPGNFANRKERTPQENTKIDPQMAVVQHEVNTSGKSKQFLLPDGSAIVLSDSSELTYKEPVNGSRRDVYLVGKADFKVAKNNAKPFTVFSETISTTAIGTKFTVTAKEMDNVIRIRLYEGKVVVKSLNGYSANWKKEIYLRSGQELVFDKRRRSATVSKFTLEKQSGNAAANTTKDSPTIPHYNKGSWFMFNNQSLSEIFDALADMYDTKIVYTRKDVKDMYFIGTYDKSDSLEKILKQIALLNNLVLTKQNDTFRIKKQTIKK